MGGDLNLKKSWHPVLMQAGTTEEMEGYLLGKRRIDGLLKNDEHKKLEKTANEESFMALQHANTVRDTASKIRDDPMLAIKKQEQAAYEAMMNDPVKRRLLLKVVGGDAPAKEKERSHRKHRHHHHHHHHRDDKRHGQDDEEHSYRRTRKRPRTENEDKYDRDDAHYNRRRSASSSYSRSPSPYRRRRSPSPYYHARRPLPQRRRSRSPQNPRKDDYRLKQSKSWSAPYRKESFPSNQQSPQPPAIDDRAAKLLAMQQAASELDDDREKRVSALNTRDAAEREVEDAARARAAKYGGKGDFVNGLHRKAGDMDIGERMRRGRGGLERERDEL